MLIFLSLFQAVGFLVSSNSHAISEDTELNENVYTNNGYGETTSLLEQVLLLFLVPCPCNQCLLPIVVIMTDSGLYRN